MNATTPKRLPRLEQWFTGGHSFAFCGHEIFFRDSAGPARVPVLLLLHGFPTSSFDWHLQWEPLAKRFRVVALDMLGFGFSAKPPDVHYSIGTQADCCEELLLRLGITEAHLLAHDYGDTVAQELLARLIDRTQAGRAGLQIRSVCLLNGGLFPEAHRALLIQKLLASKLGPVVARFMSPRGFRKRFAAIFGPNTKPTAEELSEYWAVISERGGVQRFPKLIGYIAERRQYRERWVGALCRSNVPIRFINGVGDPISGGHMARRYRELIPQPDVVELAGIGHYPQVEAPDAVLNAFLEFQGRLAIKSEPVRRP
jgi:pimeloyl-ACP methyl ester carboxylesterase